MITFLWLLSASVKFDKPEESRKARNERLSKPNACLHQTGFYMLSDILSVIGIASMQWNFNLESIKNTLTERRPTFNVSHVDKPTKEVRQCVVQICRQGCGLSAGRHGSGCHALSKGTFYIFL